MKIISLSAENFKRLNAITIKPDGSTVIVGGKNGAGKSSALDAIASALGGKRVCPEKPIRHGEEKAIIILETEELLIKRVFNDNGTTSINVASKGGKQFTSPQSMLDKLIGSLSFDPLAFSRMRPVDQLETVKKLIGLDFSELDKKREHIFDVRTEANREVKRLKALLDKLPVVNAEEKEVNIADMVKELNKRIKTNRENEILRNDYNIVRKEYATVVEEIKALEEKREILLQRGKVLGEKVKDLKDENVDEIQSNIDNAEQININVREMNKRREAEQELENAELKAKNLSNEIMEIDNDKRKQIQSAKYPIDDLLISDTGIELKGIPFEQTSSAEQLRCSVSIGLATNKDLKVLLIKDGSLLDKDNLAIIAEMAEKADAQVWIERVSEGNECTVIIEEGDVKEC